MKRASNAKQKSTKTHANDCFSNQPIPKLSGKIYFFEIWFESNIYIYYGSSLHMCLNSMSSRKQHLAEIFV